MPVKRSGNDYVLLLQLARRIKCCSGRPNKQCVDLVGVVELWFFIDRRGVISGSRIGRK